MARAKVYCAACVLLACVSSPSAAGDIKAEEKVIARIEKLSGGFVRDEQRPDRPVVRVDH
jgi:hypothetical protein